MSTMTTTTTASTMTTIRGTTSLAVAPTQNTAPVFEFRCLYTHDLRKKKKIWHDGSLRFHTFNRRVMVYDDFKNYIGDAHWRETGDFLEGEELRLDKGVMVEVGEQIGQTETDLAPVILEKRRAEVAISPPRMPHASNAYSSGSRPTGTISQARPKSLAAVLGASQGPIGRARLPARSPFEQRQVNIQRPPETCEAPPAKRPRTITEKADKENRLNNSASVRQIPPAAAQASEAVNRSRNHPSPQQQPSLALKKTVRSAAGSIARPPPMSPQHDGKESGRNEHEALSVAASLQPPCPSTLNGVARIAQRAVHAGIVSAAASHSSKQKASPPKLALQSKTTKGVKAVALNSASSNRQVGGIVTAKLRFRKEKPRKKLMYRDLLPHVSRGKYSSRVNVCGSARNREDKGNRGRATENRRNTGKPLHQENAIIDLLSEIEEDLPMAQQTPVPRNIARTHRENLSPSPSALPSPSPMFVNESPLSAGFSPSQRSLDEDFHPPIRSRSPSPPSAHHDGTGVPQRLQENPARNVTNLENGPAVSDIPTAPAAISMAPSEFTFSDKQLPPVSAEIECPTFVRPPQPAPPPQQSPKPRPFRRIRSEGDSHLDHEIEATRAETRPKAAKVTTTTTSVPHGPPRWAQAPFKSPTKLLRSASDVGYSARQQRPDAPVKAAPIAPAVEACFEPWSEVEAYILFDWWPPNREKPVFGLD
jgi:Protein of unknown function (DUF2439)